MPEAEAMEKIQSRKSSPYSGWWNLLQSVIRGAQSLRKNSTHAAGRLEGLIPTSEDWHAKVCYLQVRTI